ncbi:MAG: glutathione synthase [Xanthomonadales bacterium]|nr:glutathione synthase [Xanthomonadales bacterium]
MSAQRPFPDRPLRTGVVMDPIGGINIRKDSTFAMMLEAQRRGHELLYMEPSDIWVDGGEARASWRPVRVEDNTESWFELGERVDRPLGDLDVVLMRRDPPFDMDYVYLTYALELAEAAGALVVNRPQALRDANEKFYITHFPQCCTPFAISRQAERLLAFAERHGQCVVKPLDGMGGESIFQLNPGDPNTKVILEAITKHDTELVMVQTYIPEITQGDKRILMVDGEPVPYALARLPGKGDFRGNLAKGGRGEGVPLSDRDRWICAQVAPALRAKGILFAGLDVIGDWLTEINVTSPTCIRELDAEYGLNIAGQLFDAVERRLAEDDNA